MNTVFRNDPIKLHPGVQQDDFEKFIAAELLPFFDKKYATPAGNAPALLKSQRLLKGTKEQRKYQWLTEWSGPAERLQSFAFEAVLVDDDDFAETDQVLKKLESFGMRFPASVLTEVAKQAMAPENSILSSHRRDRFV